MKIDISELPKIHSLLDRLIYDQRVRDNIAGCDAAQFRVASAGKSVDCEISRDELLAVMQARVDAGLKTLNTLYYIEFKNFNEVAMPLVQQTDVTNVDDGPATAPSHSELLHGGETYVR